MSDKDIEIFLKDLEDSEFGMSGLKYEEKIDGKINLINYASKIRNLKYLEKDLKLINIIEENKRVGISFHLSSKGREVLRKGNWIKYSKDKTTEKKEIKKRKNMLFYIGFFIPLIATIISLLAVIDTRMARNETKEQKERIIQLEKSIKKDRKLLMRRIDSFSLKYHKDIRILNEKIEKKK
tara:strand:- start:614 stop:1156 length:543 start_codon:yes stop_codon:yes gene_type:complete